MASQERKSQYWGIEYNEPVTYRIYWVDPKFRDWACSAYGSERQLFDQVAQVVSTKETKHLGKHHPTGGRVQVYELPKAFQDPKFNLPCFEIDAKGIGLTTAGVDQFNKHHRLSEGHREIIISPGEDHECWGPEGLKTAEAEVHDLGIVRSLGILAPYPGAILVPEEFVVDGVKRKTPEIKKMFKMTEDDELAILIRAYPINSTRAADLIGVLDLNDLTEESLISRFKGEQNKKNELITKIRQARTTWQRFEKQRVKQGLKSQLDERNFDLSYFKYIYEKALSQLTLMLKLGISPVTGKESPTQRTCHTTLHNWTTVCALVEWSPVTPINRLPLENKFKHVEKLVTDAHGFIVTMGTVSLPDFTLIPPFRQFVRDLSTRASNAETKQLCQTYHPYEKGTSFQAAGDYDFLIEWLQENQRKIV